MSDRGPRLGLALVLILLALPVTIAVTWLCQHFNLLAP